MRCDTFGISALLGAALLTAGCGDLLSLLALYTSQDNVVDPALEDTWENKDNLLTIERAADFYEVRLQPKKDPSEAEEYEVRRVNIGGVRFADLLSKDIIGHMFLKVRVTGDQLRFAFFDSEWLRQRIPHEEVDQVNHRKQAVLTRRPRSCGTWLRGTLQSPKRMTKSCRTGVRNPDPGGCDQQPARRPSR